MKNNLTIDSFFNPQRSVEARAWLSSHREEAKAWRGQQGEGLIHWAALNDVALLSECLQAGLDINTLDDEERTPMDWLNDRLWMVCVERSSGLDDAGRWRVRNHTENQVPVVWSHGGRPGPQGQACGPVWSRAGLWSMVPLLLEDGTLTGWSGWGVHEETILHGWILAPENPEKYRFLEHLLSQGWDIDSPDALGRTPLWYAVDAWLARPLYADVLEPAIMALVKNGADVFHTPPGHPSPSVLVDTLKSSPSLRRRLHDALAPVHSDANV